MILATIGVFGILILGWIGLICYYFSPAPIVAKILFTCIALIITGMFLESM